jgi:hypothetical protein
MLVIEPPVLGSESLIVRVIVWLVSAVVVLSLKLTLGGLRAVTVLVDVALLVVRPELSVAFT